MHLIMRDDPILSRVCNTLSVLVCTAVHNALGDKCSTSQSKALQVNGQGQVSHSVLTSHQSNCPSQAMSQHMGYRIVIERDHSIYSVDCGLGALQVIILLS